MKFINQSKNQIQCVLISFVIGLVAAAAIVTSIPQSTYGQAIAPGPQIPNGAVTTPKIANGAVTTPKIADHAVTAR